MIDDQAIQINSPLRGTSFQDGGGANVILSFQPAGSAVPTNSLFIVDGIGWYTVPDNPPYSVNITLPVNGPIGKVCIIALAVDTSGLRLADTSFINIIPTGTLDSLVVEPKNIKLDSAIRETPIHVNGYFSNGSVTKIADLTEGTTGTVYMPQTNAIFSVNQNGVIRALAAGTDTLVITYGNKFLRVPVTVDSNFLLATYYVNLIDFSVIGDKTLGEDPFGLNAVASSGDDVVFSVYSGSATIQNGILNVDATGQVTIKASQSGNNYFAPATDVFRSFCVKPVKPVISSECNTLSSNIANGNQWYKNGIEISGATNQIFIVSDSGTYTARVTSNGCQSASSDPISVGAFPIASWTGNTSNAWENAANWSCGSVPDSNTDVIINSGVARYPEVNSNVSCRSLMLKQGATILIKTGYTINVLRN